MPPIYQHDPFLFIQGFLWQDAFWTDWFWIGFTTLCEGWVSALVALLYVWARTRKTQGLFRAALPAFITLLVAGVAANLLKEVFDTPRPLGVFDPGKVHVLLEPLRLNAFPSGHSATAAALAGWALLRWGRSAWPFLVLAFLGGLSRVMVGAHWTFDVLGGWTLGALCAFAVHAVGLFVARRRKSAEPPTTPAVDRSPEPRRGISSDA